MSILNLNGPAGRPARGKRAVKVWMGIGLVIAVLGVGSTLASTITINSGQNTEFGQGVERTVYCGGDQKITIVPISGYINNPDPIPSQSSEPEDEGNPAPTTPPGDFYLSGIRVSDIPDECAGVDFVLSVYEASGSNAPIEITGSNADSVISPNIYWNKTEIPRRDVTALSLSKESFVSPGSLASVSPGARSEGKGSFTVTFAALNMRHATIDSVSRILIETQDDTFGKDGIDHGDVTGTYTR
ncbi:hypothetical protein MCEMRE22_01027 [Candidatus Nanopelagicaceae bacterium]